MSNECRRFSPVNTVEASTACEAFYKCSVCVTLTRLMSSPQRRIEDRIRKLCAKAASATDGDLEPALDELTQLLRSTIGHMRDSATRLLVGGKPLSEPRRRATDHEV